MTGTCHCNGKGYYWLADSTERQQVRCSCLAGLRWGLKGVSEGVQEAADERDMARQEALDDINWNWHK